MAAKAPTIKMAGSSVWARSFPKTTAAWQIVSDLFGLAVGAARVMWPFRLEIALAAIPVITWIVLSAQFGHPTLFAVIVIAAVAGMFSSPKSRAVLIGVLRVARVKRWFITAMGELRVANTSGKLPRIASGESTAVGERLTLITRPGQSAELLETRVEELRAATKAKDLRVARDPRNANIVYADIIRRDPLADIPEVDWADQGADVLSGWDPIHFGIDEAGQPVRVSLVGRSLLIGGDSGSGKSSLLTAITSHAAKSPDAAMVLIDPNDVQFGPWTERAWAYASDDPIEAVEALELVRGELDRRKKLLRAQPGVQRKLTREIAEWLGIPLLFLQIDELAYHTSIIGTGSGPFAKAARDIAARGRAFGISTIAATQRPTGAVVPTELRDLFPLRYALRTATMASSDVILGEGWARQGYSATDIDINNRGVGWLRADGALPKKIKNPWISDDTVADLSVTTIRHRPKQPTPALADTTAE